MHVNKKNLTLYHATDPHLFFTFNGTYSRNCNLFIVNDNKGGGTKFVASPDNTVSFATPDYQNNTYYLGTTKKQKTFKHTVAANMLSQHEVQQILQWLKVGEVGFLSYDTNPYWGWDVVVTSVGDVSQYEASDGSIIEFAVEFKTINDWHARSNYDAVKQFGGNAIDGFYDESDGKLSTHSIANEYGIPEIVVDGSTIYLPQVSDEHSFVNIDWVISESVNSTTQQCKVEYEGQTLYDYNFVRRKDAQFINYLGQYGFSLVGSQLVEDKDGLVDSSTASELLIFDNTLPQDVTHLFDKVELPETTSVLGRAILGKAILGERSSEDIINKQWHALGEGAFQCLVFEKTPGIGWDIEEFALGAVGNQYGVSISIIKNLVVDDNGNVDTTQTTYCNKQLGTCTGNPKHVYIGKCNALTVTGKGTMTTIKHNSL